MAFSIHFWVQYIFSRLLSAKARQLYSAVNSIDRHLAKHTGNQHTSLSNLRNKLQHCAKQINSCARFSPRAKLIGDCRLFLTMNRRAGEVDETFYETFHEH